MTLAQHRLIGDGAYLMTAAELDAGLGADRNAWQRFGRHWDALADDPYAAELGTRRLRRYGHFAFVPADAAIDPMPHDAFVQPQASNPLYVDRSRHFEPLTDAFVEEPLLQRFLRLLGQVATMLDDLPRWSVKVTPFRVLASTSDGGDPTPEGLHRDGVTLVTSLLIGRDNAVGGESSVFSADGRHLLSTTLSEPGTLLLGDDRRTLHGVTPIRPLDPTKPARRDVLVVTFAPMAS
ncbi:hypothetical protein A5765_01015 [Mycolicibacterium celeriflavum]|uniref:2OG-Fe dioxygenase family protein n=1 Tax=Mycolicibacterium celeriflavum TaxID=1249101 RepID=UPI0007FF14F6|nr:2OG-Fe dioxygenase family protein [Mycolicibacterium celeriflavum]OBG13152.1 hypothetical protein A5765_01015 [Mycolicibacterium celeriflavum]